jgi:hypothetical protein
MQNYARSKLLYTSRGIIGRYDANWGKIWNGENVRGKGRYRKGERKSKIKEQKYPFKRANLKVEENYCFIGFMGEKSGAVETL